MSATRDKSQRVAFVYTNLYQIYRRNQNQPKDGNEKSGSSVSTPIKGGPVRFQADQKRLKASQSQNVIKAVDLKTGQLKEAIKVHSYEPMIFARLRQKAAGARKVTKESPRRPELVKSEVLKKGKEVTKNARVAQTPVQGLKENLKTLNELQNRLSFMLKELEDLVKE